MLLSVEVGWKVVPELPKTNSNLSLFFFFCYAWCMLVNSLWNLNLYSGVRPYTRGKIQISQWFTGMWQVLKSVETVFTKKRLKWDRFVANPWNHFLERLFWGKNGTYGGRSRTNSLDFEIPKKYRINYFEFPHLNYRRWGICSFHKNKLWLIFVCF